MKKNSLIIATIALVIASCSDVDTLKKDIQTNNEGNEAISFDSYTSKITRAENSGANYSWIFKNHLSDFEVWAYKNPNASETAKVFNGQVIDAKDDGTFDYHVSTEARYWDKAATTTYHFYAAAPATNGNWNFEDGNVVSYATHNKGYFTTSSTLQADNLRSATTDDSKITSLTETNSSFKAVADIDKMIAAPTSGNYDNYAVAGGHKVQLHFNHILSKMNVTVKKDQETLGTRTVKLVSIEIFGLNNKGDFSEATAAVTTGTYARWNNLGKVQVNNKDVTYKFANESGVTLSDASTGRIYFIESLVIPQPTETEILNYDGTVPEVLYTLDEFNDLKKAEDNTWTDLDADGYTNYTPASDKVKQAAAASPSKPYFKISYTIDNELFTSYHNLAGSFKPAGKETLDFYEGFQNTLNINIKPEKIEFTADVADWADNANVIEAELD